MTTATAGMKPCKKCIYILPSMSQPCKSVQYGYRSKNLLGLNIHRQRSVRKEDKKVSPCASRSLKHVEVSHFTLLFCRGRQGNVPRFKTHVHSFCFAH